MVDEPHKKKKSEEQPFRSPIADPFAESSLSKKIVKVTSKFSEGGLAKRGVKEVVKALKKKKRGIVILAGDITPIELVAHIPVICENNGNPYIYVKTKDYLGTASLSKRPTTVFMLSRPPKAHDLKDAYDELYEEISNINPYLQDK
ncbi:NHP2 [Blepharisma stoltei]|uniref:Ribosomal protein eL8/eL30/eS12/Gadd45 domain-containing protein n=1 Tax=Blepharisma stoltei TaxID=1481888 RepID=A0AAU9JHC1_9CILI|nr:unnamed protein product [Blepharisma stoltei]